MKHEAWRQLDKQAEDPPGQWTYLRELWVLTTNHGVRTRAIRIDVRKDNSVQWQSYAKAEVWTDLGWKEIATLLPGTVDSVQGAALRLRTLIESIIAASGEPLIDS